MSNRANKILTALLTLTLGLCAAVPTVQAQEAQTAEAAALSRTSDAGLSSQGNLVYEDRKTGAQIYTADFLLLKNKLDTIPDRAFEPARYTHSHQWEYLDINGETHTIHCEICGNAFDLVNAHRAERRESCSLSHDGAAHPGTRYTCVCGYQWVCETSHTLFFEPVDETGHRSKCRLDGTKFCPGYEPVTEEHYAYYYKPCEDGSHHEKICLDCGYSHEEACSFTLSDTDSGGETDGAETDSSDDANVNRCRCGNAKKTAPETEPENAGAKTGEKDSGTEAGEENTGEEAGENSSGAETGEENTNEEPNTESKIDASGAEAEKEVR